jgi:hypothetical protein
LKSVPQPIYAPPTRWQRKQSWRLGCFSFSGRSPPCTWQARQSFSILGPRCLESGGTGGLLSLGEGSSVRKMMTASANPMTTRSDFWRRNLTYRRRCQRIRLVSLRGARPLVCHCEADEVSRSNLVVSGQAPQSLGKAGRDCHAPCGRSQ